MANLFRASAIRGRARHVVFVHGLGGHYLHTWSATSDSKTSLVHWLEDDLPDVDSWAVDYPASVSRWRGTAMHLVDRATNVLSLLIAEPDLHSGDIVFVGHSLGGLLIKQVMRAADELRHTNERAAGFLRRVRAVAFLATPHAGAGLASAADRLRLIVRPSAATASLVRNDSNLRDLNNWYRSWVARNDVPHLVLTENQPTSVLGVVVLPDSSDPGLNVTPVPIDANHVSICKPADRNAHIYKLLKDFVARPFRANNPSRPAEERLSQNIDRLEILLDQQGKQHVVATVALGKLAGELERAIESGYSSAVDHAASPGATGLIDTAITEGLLRLRRARFFRGYSALEHATRLAEGLRFGELAGGSPSVRARALAWCARIVGGEVTSAVADDLIEASRRLGDSTELRIAEARRMAAKGELSEALSHLADIDLPIARSAAFIFVCLSKEERAPFAWLTRAGLSFHNLDGDGKFSFLLRELELSNWPSFLLHASNLTATDFLDAPVLLHAAAVASLLRTVPEELRRAVTNNLPLGLKRFPLASDEESMQARRRARALFDECANAARKLGCIQAANVADDFALWLDLVDPERSALGRERLQESLRDSAHSLRRVQFAVEFGIELNLEAIEAEIQKRVTLAGKANSDVALARFALALRNPEPRAMVEYINRYRDQLKAHIDSSYLGAIEAEVLARAGQIDQATARLAELVANGLAADSREYIANIIEQIRDGDQTAGLRARYEASRSLVDLANLVQRLETECEWQDLAVFSRILFEHTRSIGDAERFARALHASKRHEELDQFLNANIHLADQSDNFRLAWCWALYRSGEVQRADAERKKLTTSRDTESDRDLAVVIAITAGDWESLASLVEREWSERAGRSPRQLLRAAQLGHAIGSPRSRELMFVAADRAEDDANILAGAYFLAATAGWEEDAAVGKWLSRAIELSKDEGPLQRISLKEILDRQPEWSKREQEAWQLLRRAELPLFGAARILNRSLIEWFLLPSLANTDEQDPRKRRVVPAYSGTHRKAVPGSLRVIGLDPSALLTLTLLGLLGEIRASFERVVVPHSTLRWLFEETNKLAFHQPSRVKHAHELRQLLATGSIKKFQSSTARDPGLAAEIGEDLASLLTEAVSEGSLLDGRQRLVVVAGPVDRIGSLMMEQANLSSFEKNMSSCLSIVKKLKENGLITSDEERTATSYLTFQGCGGAPYHAEIDDNAILLLDDLATEYLRHVGLLGKLGAATLEVLVSSREVDEANALIGYAGLAARVAKAIEDLRVWLAEGIRSGSCRLAKFVGDDDAEVSSHPTFAAVSLASEQEVEVLVSDDRFLNKHSHLDEPGRQVPVVTTIEIIDHLLASAVISEGRWSACRTMLRRCGYVFVPVSHGELTAYLTSSGSTAQLIECAELRVIRESLLLARMSGFHQLPLEGPWLDGVVNAVVHALRGQWSSEISDEVARARSKWLLPLLDMRGWAGSLGRAGSALAVAGYGSRVMQLLISQDMPADVASRYTNWVDTEVLARLEDDDPQTFNWVVERARQLIASLVAHHAGAGATQ